MRLFKASDRLGFNLDNIERIMLSDELRKLYEVTFMVGNSPQKITIDQKMLDQLTAEFEYSEIPIED